MSSYADHLNYPDHLSALAQDLEAVRKDVVTRLGADTRAKHLIALASSSVKVGAEIRAWENKLDKEAEQLTDEERLDDLRVWLLNLPAHARKSFYERCALDELGQASSGIRITVGTR